MNRYIYARVWKKYIHNFVGKKVYHKSYSKFIFTGPWCIGAYNLAVLLSNNFKILIVNICTYICRHGQQFFIIILYSLVISISILHIFLTVSIREVSRRIATLKAIKLFSWCLRPWVWAILKKNKIYGTYSKSRWTCWLYVWTIIITSENSWKFVKANTIDLTLIFI